MKKILLFAVMLIAAASASAQSNACQDEETLSVKPYAGFSLGDMTKTSRNTKQRSGFVAGIEAQYMCNEWLGISAGAAYSQQGIKIAEGAYNGETLQSNYLNIPVLVNLYILKGLALKVGVQPGFLINSKFHIDGGFEGAEDYDVKDYIRSFDLAIPVGISYEVNNIVFDARYNVGALDALKEHSFFDAEQNMVFQLTLGYRINFQ